MNQKKTESNPSQFTTIAIQLITYEFLFGIFLFIVYIYIYTIKASYLSYFHIPHEYTDINLAELLNNTWVLGAFLELILFGLYGYFVILSIDLTNYLFQTKRWETWISSIKHKVLVKTGCILLIQLVNFLLFSCLYYCFFLATEKTLRIIHLDSAGHTELNLSLLSFIVNDIIDSPELILISLLIIGLMWLVRHREIKNGDPQYSLKTAIIYGFCACSFLFTLFLYTGAVDLGRNYAESERVYPFIKENGKLTPQMIVATYRDDYIVITIHKENNRYYLTPNINDGTFSLIPIHEDKKKIEIINMKLRNGLQTNPIPISEEKLFKQD